MQVGDSQSAALRCKLQKLTSGPAIRVQLHWYKSASDEWQRLAELDVARLDHYGVFVIWRNGGAARPSVVLYVGHGALRSEIAQCREAPLFGGSDLRITWARVDDARDVEAIAAYLYQQLRPLWGQVVTSTQRLAINTPWAA
jgi:hypothetical protein